jgi:hypothetical protein
MEARFLLALVSGLACARPTPTHAQSASRGAAKLIGTWKGTAVLSKGDSATFTVVFQPNAVGYWVSAKPSPFTYSLLKTTLLKLSNAGKSHRYSIDFPTADQFRILSYPDQGDVEEIALVETVIFKRQQVPAAMR